MQEGDTMTRCTEAFVEFGCISGWLLAAYHPFAFPVLVNIFCYKCTRYSPFRFHLLCLDNTQCYSNV